MQNLTIVLYIDCSFEFQAFFPPLKKHQIFIQLLAQWFTEVSLFLATSCFPLDSLLGSVEVTRRSTLLSLLMEKRTLCSSEKLNPS